MFDSCGLLIQLLTMTTSTPISFEAALRALQESSDQKLIVGPVIIVEHYAEKQQLIVADSSVYGVVCMYTSVTAWTNDDAVPTSSSASDFLAPGKSMYLTVTLQKKGKYLNFIVELGQEVSPSVAVTTASRPVAVVRSSVTSISGNPSVLFLVEANNLPFIDFKYQLSAALKTKSEAQWRYVTESFHRHKSVFQRKDLEAIAAFQFGLGGFLLPLRVPLASEVSSGEDVATIQALREAAQEEILRRVVAGDVRDPMPCIALPAGKQDVTFWSPENPASSTARFRNPFEAALQELVEETGMQLSGLKFLGSAVVSSTNSDLAIAGRTLTTQTPVFYFEEASGSWAGQQSLLQLESVYLHATWLDPVLIKRLMDSDSVEEKNRFQRLQRIGSTDEVFALLTQSSAALSTPTATQERLFQQQQSRQAKKSHGHHASAPDSAVKKPFASSTTSSSTHHSHTSSTTASTTASSSDRAWTRREALPPAPAAAVSAAPVKVERVKPEPPKPDEDGFTTVPAGKNNRRK